MSFNFSLDFTDSTKHFVTLGNKPDDTVFKWLISDSNISALLKPSCKRHDICSDEGRYPTVKQLESFDSILSVGSHVSSCKVGSVNLRLPNRFYNEGKIWFRLRGAFNHPKWYQNKENRKEHYHWRPNDYIKNMNWCIDKSETCTRNWRSQNTTIIF